ncbi:PAS domain-containing protein [Echinicola shivajiensis]|uniref:PAS domain-containing protein n=1 Tax=Echinicola shivajiensis TaxID=1035916 RepID=UPI001BFC4698|nr:PAS domain-containing protein [Echinicola shivajiensis]
MISNKQLKYSHKKTPLKCWDIYIQSVFSKKLPSSLEKDQATLEYFESRFNWSTGLDMLKESYDALVLTDLNESILWVNQGFQKMTGYVPQFAIGKKPSFLQGEDTSPLALRDFKKKLAVDSPFRLKLINYKFDQSPYLCEIHIFPMKNESGNTSHLLALETEI